jgi:hypothetical protein
MQLYILAILLFLGTLVGAKRIYIPPLDGKNGTEHCLVIIQGAQIATKRYVDIASAIQHSVPFPLHGIPSRNIQLLSPSILSTWLYHSQSSSSKLSTAVSKRLRHTFLKDVLGSWPVIALELQQHKKRLRNTEMSTSLLFYLALLCCERTILNSLLLF